mmetsp:Transcript_19842/g.50265  ORF Transcript_19842/g.50265 Transcript_19842/m.50265 type:complete len:240 (-) Transcript_19842:94-813(-)
MAPASAPPFAQTTGNVYPGFAAAPGPRATAPELANNIPPASRPVVMANPSPFVVNMLQRGKWSSGLLTGCMGDPGGCHACLYTSFCPCMAFGDITAKMQGGEVVLGGSWLGGCVAHYLLGGCITMWNLPFCNLWMWATCTHLVHVPTRTAIRHRYNIPGTELGDCCEIFWCEPCALVQERKELMLRGEIARHPTAVASVVSVPNARNAIYSHGATNGDAERPWSGGSDRKAHRVAPAVC